MFIYKLSSKLDKLDPYWYARLMALKAAYLATGMFIANLLLRPSMPSVTMLLSGVGVFLAEMPTMNDLDKKDKIYLGYIILISLTVIIFSSTSYMQVPFLIAIAGWAYLLYFVLRKKPEVFSIVSVLLMLATISQEGINTGNYFTTWNTVLFILEFALIGFWLHKMFPFLYHKIWLSSFIRSLETIAAIAKSGDVVSSLVLRKHSMVSKSSLLLLKNKPYVILASAIHKDISAYHYYLYNLISTDDKDFSLTNIVEDFSVLLHAVKNLQICAYTVRDADYEELDFHNTKFSEILLNWNKLCEHVSN